MLFHISLWKQTLSSNALKKTGVLQEAILKYSSFEPLIKIFQKYTA